MTRLKVSFPNYPILGEPARMGIGLGSIAGWSIAYGRSREAVLAVLIQAFDLYVDPHVDPC